MNLKKSDDRGTSLMRCDPVNRVLFGQWKDNKLVSFISTLGKYGQTTVERRVGATKEKFDIPQALYRYTTDNFMGGVDSHDKDKSIGGSFVSRAGFCKWYRMGLMGVFNFMAVNGRQCWNMSCKMIEGRAVLSNSEFWIGLAKEMFLF